MRAGAATRCRSWCGHFFSRHWQWRRRHGYVHAGLRRQRVPLQLGAAQYGRPTAIGVWLEKPDVVSALLNADLVKDDESSTARAPPARRAVGGRGAITTARDMQAGVPDGECVAARAVGLHVCRRRRSGARTTRGRTGAGVDTGGWTMGRAVGRWDDTAGR
ncbi:hypothetical protein EI94DRAFT_1170512 [Lactarius quietus]|nr:hypothetical protein EI94DRAFT_1170512 [Lactarius quietus]